MNREEFDALHKLLSEQVLPEYQTLYDVESFWTILLTAQSISAVKVLEIGRKGYANMCFWNRAMNRGNTLVTVNSDLATLDMVGVGLDEEGCQVNLFVADPGDWDTFVELRRVIGGIPVDVLSFDGLCEYETIKEDFEMYSPLVRPGGKIAVCNLYHPPILKLWEELDYPKKIVYNDGAGVGIVGL